MNSAQATIIAVVRVRRLVRMRVGFELAESRLLRSCLSGCLWLHGRRSPASMIQTHPVATSWPQAPASTSLHIDRPANYHPFTRRQTVVTV